MTMSRGSHSRVVGTITQHPDGQPAVRQNGADHSMHSMHSMH